MKPIITVLLLFFVGQIKAQIYVEKGVSTTAHFQTHLLYTSDGDEFIGRTVSFDSGLVSFKIIGANEAQFDIKQVDSIKVLRAKYFNRFFRSDFGERTTFVPTAFSLERGALEYHNEFIFINTVNYGVRDNFTVGFSAVPIPNSYNYDVHLKISQSIGEHIHVALGGVMGAGVFENWYYDFYYDNGLHQARYFMPFAAISLGSRMDFINFTAGPAFVDESGVGEQPSFVYGLNAGMRISNRLRAFIERGNIYRIFDGPISNAGIGIVGKKSIFNIGLFFGEGVELVFPSLSYSRRLLKN